MILILLALWFIFNGRITLEIALFGLFFSGLVFLFMCRFMDYSPKKDKALLLLFGYFLRYAALLVVEIFKSTLGAVRFILSKKKKPKPMIIKFRTALKTQAARVLLANSITLTPGTITVSLDGDVFTVHCLDASMGDGIERSSFVTLLLRMEEVSNI